MTVLPLPAAVAEAPRRRWACCAFAVAALVSTGCGARPITPATGCHQVGAARVSAPEDLAALASCVSLRGLTVRSGAVLDLARLVALEAIDGDVSIGPTVGLELVELPNLRRVAGTLRIAGNGALSGVFLPRLEAAGEIEIEDNPTLTTVAMPQLARVSGRLRMSHDGDLEAVSMNALRDVGELALLALPKLSVLQLDRLGAVGTWSVPELPALDAADLAALRQRVSGAAAP
jgi:hypothetical protein